MTRPPRSADTWVIAVAAGLWLVLFLFMLSRTFTGRFDA